MGLLFSPLPQTLSLAVPLPLPTPLAELPDHTQLPGEEPHMPCGFSQNHFARVLTESLQQLLALLHPDGQYAIGQDSYIYHTPIPPPLPPTRGAAAPDWYYVPGVPPLLLDGESRRSYVLWRERVIPPLLMEFASGDGSEERDPTPGGKFYIYERLIRAHQYAIWIERRRELEMYELVGGRYRRQTPNAAGRYPIPALGVELGVWYGRIGNLEIHWLRWWYPNGVLLLTGEERAEQEKAAKEEERRLKEAAQQQADDERRQTEEERRLKKAAQRLANTERRQKEAAHRLADTERRQKEEAQQLADTERRQKEAAQQLADKERRQKEEAQRQATRLAERLRALGIDPELP